MTTAPTRWCGAGASGAVNVTRIDPQTGHCTTMYSYAAGVSVVPHAVTLVTYERVVAHVLATSAGQFVMNGRISKPTRCSGCMCCRPARPGWCMRCSSNGQCCYVAVVVLSCTVVARDIWYVVFDCV